MNSRFLTVAAIAAMLLATGCGGGAGAHANGFAPTTSGIGTGASPTTSGTGASFAVSFQVPIADVAAATGSSSSSRSPQYVSPGSTGLQILLGAAGPTTFAVGTQAAPIALVPTPAGGITANLNTGAYGVNTASAPFTAGTAQLSGNIAYNAGAVGTVLNVNTIPGSSTITPAVGQSFTITNTDNPATGVFTATVKTVGGTPGTGLLMTATVTAETTGTNSLGWTTGNIINFSAGNTSQSTYTYTFTANPNTAGNQAPGYYTATITFNNMIGGQNYVVGVVLTDISNNNFILSENKTAITPVAAQGPTVIGNLTLIPLVAGVWIPTPIAQTAAQTTADGAPANSFESTVFLTDEKGYVIPNQSTVIGTADNTPTITITSNPAGALTIGSYNNGLPCSYSSLANTNTSLVAPPAAPFVGAGCGTPYAAATANTLTIQNGSGTPNYSNIEGSLLANQALPTAPLALGLVSGVTTNVNGVGNPIALTCASGISAAGLTVKLSSVNTTGLSGYTYTPGTNIPAAGPTTLSASPSFSAPTINCNSSIVLPIN